MAYRRRFKRRRFKSRRFRRRGYPKRRGYRIIGRRL